MLTHYDPAKPLYLQTDASPYGLGATLSHKMKDGSDRPILFLSRSLRPAEKNYSQIDREACAIFWATKKLIYYLYGRHFTLVTDNLPLTRIFSPSKALPAYSAARLQRYAVFLSGLNYAIEHRRGSRHANCDALSRLPLKDNSSTDSTLDTTDVLFMNALGDLPIDSADIKRYTQRDVTLSKVYGYLQSGEWIQTDDAFTPYYRRRTELSTFDGCIFWGNRIVIPPPLETQILQIIHDTHMGMAKSKALARCYVYFPNIDDAIEKMCRNCPECVSHLKAPQESQLFPNPLPQHAWERIHIDHAELDNQLYLLVIDANSKFPEIMKVNSTNSETTIQKLQDIFARFGLPKYIHSDNAQSFKSERFTIWCKKLGVKQIFSTPFNPRGNGQVERLVQSFKQSMRAMKNETIPAQYKLNKFLFRYRITPHCVTHEAPAKLLLGRVPRNQFDLLRRNLQDTVQQEQSKSVKNDYKLREFSVGERVLAKDYRPNDNRFVSATVASRNGPRSYTVMTSQGGTWRRTCDMLHKTGEFMEKPRGNDVEIPPTECTHTEPAVKNQAQAVPTAITSAQPRAEIEDTEITVPPEPRPPAVNQPQPTGRPIRARKQTRHYGNNIYDT